MAILENGDRHFLVLSYLKSLESLYSIANVYVTTINAGVIETPNSLISNSDQISGDLPAAKATRHLPLWNVTSTIPSFLLQDAPFPGKVRPERKLRCPTKFRKKNSYHLNHCPPETDKMFSETLLPIGILSKPSFRDDHPKRTAFSLLLLAGSSSRASPVSLAA